MLPLVSVLVGTLIFLSFSLWLWYMRARPNQWARFTEAENAFWVKRGLPIKWAAACKQFEQGRGLKVLVAFCVLVAVILTIAPFILRVIFPRHG
jgi:hypothetical protein